MKFIILGIFFIALTAYAKGADYKGKMFVDKAVDDFKMQFGDDFTMQYLNNTWKECTDLDDITECQFLKDIKKVIPKMVQMIRKHNNKTLEIVRDCSRKVFEKDMMTREQLEDKNSTAHYSVMVRMSNAFDNMIDCIMKKDVIEQCGSYNILRVFSDVDDDLIKTALKKCEDCKVTRTKNGPGTFNLKLLMKGCMNTAMSKTADLKPIKALISSITSNAMSYAMRKD